MSLGTNTKKIKHKDRALTNAPKSTLALAKESREATQKLLKNRKKDKYKMKVYDSNGKVYAELLATTKTKLKNSMITFGQGYTDRLFTYGDIKTI